MPGPDSSRVSRRFGGRRRPAQTLKPAQPSGLLAWLGRQLSLFGDAEPAPVARESQSFPDAREPESPGTGDVTGHPAFADLCRNAYAGLRVFLRPRLRESWRVQWRRREASVEVPVLLWEAPRAVKEAVLDWALLVGAHGRGRRDPGRKARRNRLEALIRAYLETGAGGGEGPSAGEAARRARNARKLTRLATRGKYQDLEAAFAAVNAGYFQGSLAARLTWSARLGGLSTHCIAHDGEGRPYHLITISRGYDHPDVTPEILAGVVYHECLHIAIPPREADGRRVVHGPDFRRRERAYAHYEVWRKWHREGLPRALRWLRRREQGPL